MSDPDSTAPHPTIRPERPEDVAAIRDLNRRAFLVHPHSEQTEHLIVDALRAAGQLTLSLVADLEGKVVGHIAFSPVAISDGSPAWFGLGPMAVEPDLQRRGIGQALVRQGLAGLRERGAHGCVLVGEPDFYGRCGFANRPELVFPGVPQEYFLALAWTDTPARGTVIYAEAFNVRAAGSALANDPRDVQDTYDRVADEYARRIFDELDGKPFDRELLDRFAERVRGTGPVYDLGCGPGHVARYLSERGVEVTGIDLAAGMVRRARELNPGIDFRQGDMRSLDLPDGGLAAAVAFYSIIHFALDELPPVFAELHRVLAPGAPLLLAFHIGDEHIELEEWWGYEVKIDFVFFAPEAVRTRLEEAGFRIAEAHLRDPYPEVEHPSRRAYILAEAGGLP